MWPPILHKNERISGGMLNLCKFIRNNVEEVVKANEMQT